MPPTKKRSATTMGEAFAGSSPGKSSKSRSKRDVKPDDSAIEPFKSPERVNSALSKTMTDSEQRKQKHMAKFVPFQNALQTDENGKDSLAMRSQSSTASTISKTTSFSLSPTRRLMDASKASNGSVDLSTRKHIADPIHTQILLDALCCRIVDTPQYQRLRELKQLGTCSFVFPTAIHTRFEHSLGVAHFSARVCLALRSHQPELNITDADILSVKVAGLCHDLGHGPFSHVYDGVFIKKMHPNGVSTASGAKWRHEDGSVAMFRHLLDSNGIRLSSYGLNAQDQLFIEEIVRGVKETERKGRLADKFYLYDIVNNMRSGLDVDKLDYFQRDMRYTTVTFANNFERFIEFGRVIRAECVEKGDGRAFEKDVETGNWRLKVDDTNEPKYQLMVCYPTKCVFEAVDLFSIRFRMHKQVYTHKGVKQVEYMITDILEKADPYIKIKGTKTSTHPDGLYKISECILDMEAFSRLNDSIIDIIEYDSNPGLVEAKEILHRIKTRKLYKCVGRSSYTVEDEKDEKVQTEEDIKMQIIEISRGMSAGEYENNVMTPMENFSTYKEEEEDEEGMMDGITPFPVGSQDSIYTIADTGCSNSQVEWHVLRDDEIIVEKQHIHYGLKDKNPVSRMRFFKKYSSNDTIGEELKTYHYNASMPKAFQEMAVRVFCKSVGKEKTASKAFDIWCKRKLQKEAFQSNTQDEGLEDASQFK